MQCQICGKQRAELLPKKSRLWPNTTLLICKTCKDGKMEPRAFVILAGRMNGANSVSDYIKNKRYCGDKILAEELVT